jgi:hypothetical protein
MVGWVAVGFIQSELYEMKTLLNIFLSFLESIRIHPFLQYTRSVLFILELWRLSSPLTSPPSIPSPHSS